MFKKMLKYDTILNRGETKIKGEDKNGTSKNRFNL